MESHTDSIDKSIGETLYHQESEEGFQVARSQPQGISFTAAIPPRSIEY